MRSHWPISILSTFSSFVNMLLPLVLVRILGPDEIGLFKIFFLYLIMIFPCFSFMTGATSGLSYWAGRGTVGTRAIQMSALVTFLSSALITAGALLFHAPIAKYMGWDAITMQIFCLGLFGATASSFYEETSIALGRIWRGAAFGSGIELFRTVAILAVAISTHSLKAIFLTHVAIYTLKALVGLGLGLREGIVSFRWDSQAFRNVWKYALPVSVAAAFGVFAGYSDQMILAKYISAADFAFYSIGCLSVPPLMILEMSVTRVLIPQLSAAFVIAGAQKSDEAARLFRRAVDELGYFLIPAVVGMIVFAPSIIEILFTSRYASAASYLRLYAFYYLVLVIPNDSVARARGAGQWIMGNFIAVSLITLGLCWSLALRFGPWGALAGLIAAKVGSRVYAVIYMRRATGWKVAEFLPIPELLRSTAVSVLLGVAAFAARPVFGSNAAWFLLCGPIFTVLYFGLTLAWSHRSDRARIMERKVLMLTQHLGVGGLERMILNLSHSAQQQTEWQPRVFVYDHVHGDDPSSHLIEDFRARGITVDVYSKGEGFSPKAVLRIARVVLNEKIQVIHSHDLGALIYAVCAKFVTGFRVRIVHTQHSFVHLARKPRYRLYERIFTFFSDELAVVSEDTRKTYEGLGVSARKLHLVPNGVAFTDRTALSRERKLELRALLSAWVPKDLQGATWILYLARIHGRKGQDHAIRLWSELNAEIRARSVLLLVGPETQRGELERIRRLATAAPDAERILFTGSARDPRIWLEASDVYLSCSEFEGMPLGPIEAAGAGLPLLLSDIAGHQMLPGTSCRYDLAAPQEGAAQFVVAAQVSRDALERIAQEVRTDYSMTRMTVRYAELWQGSRTS